MGVAMVVTHQGLTIPLEMALKNMAYLLYQAIQPLI
jgi:hypothetical protein